MIKCKEIPKQRKNRAICRLAKISQPHICLAKISQHQIPNAKIAQHPKFTYENFRKGCQQFRNPFLPYETHAKCQRSLVRNTNGQWESQRSLKTSLLKNLSLPNQPLFILQTHLLLVNPSATLWCPTWECIISTRGPRYLIIGHLFILLYLHIILLEICPCFDALYSRIGCITWSYFILYFLKLIYRHHFWLFLAFFYFLFSWLFCFLLTHVISPRRLRLHVTQKIPLPPHIFNRS